MFGALAIVGVVVAFFSMGRPTFNRPGGRLLTLAWLSFYISVLFAVFVIASDAYGDGWGSIIPFAAVTGGLFLAAVLRRYQPTRVVYVEKEADQ